MSVDVGSVKVPVLTIVPMTGLVKVLFVSVSVVLRPTRVSVDVGSVSVPVLTMVAMTGAVSVLLVRVWVTLVPTSVVSKSGITYTRVLPVVIEPALNWNLRVLSPSSWTVKSVSVTVNAGNTSVCVRPVPVLLTMTNLLALPASVGILSKPAATRSSSARIEAEVAAEPVDGNAPWL